MDSPAPEIQATDIQLSTPFSKRHSIALISPQAWSRLQNVVLQGSVLAIGVRGGGEERPLPTVLKNFRANSVFQGKRKLLKNHE